MSSNPQTSPVIAALKWMIAALIVAFPPLDVFFSPLAQSFPAVETITHYNLFWTIMLIVVYEIFLLCIYFLTQFWQQLSPGWFKELAIPLDLFVRTIFSRYRRRYYRLFFTFHRDFDVKGTGTVGEFSLEVEQVFVELHFDPTSPHRASSSPVVYSSHPYTNHHEIWEYLTTHQRLVILGAPGSGKTTLLMRLGLVLASKRSSKLKGLKRSMIPLLLFLRDHSNALTDDYTLVDAVMMQIRPWQSNIPQLWIQHQLSQGSCLVLFDGLDEVADMTQRQRMVTWVQAQMGAYGRNQFLITSRPHGYQKNPLNGVTVLGVQPFTLAQIKAFLHHWYLAIEIKSARRDDAAVRLRASKEADDLFSRLCQKEALLDLAVNPLLLTMIATVHRHRGSLPGKRIELYREICEVLLGKRQSARGLPQDLSADQFQLILQPLAYEMMSRKVSELPQRDVESLITPILPRVSSSITPHDFLQSVENTSGLLLEREHATYSFAHLTFQEYLAAVHIRECSLEQQFTALITESWWHETIRLHCAQANATTLIEACLVQAPQSVVALTLALECAAEARDLDQHVRQQLNDLVDHGIEFQDADRHRVVGDAQLARRMTKMHALNESTYIDTSLVTCAEYQLFLDEMQSQGRYFQPDHWKNSTFSPSTGKQPVLGVRRKDAITFCNWLTQRSAGFWQYRLPRYEEWQQAEKNLWRYIDENIGCWIEAEPLFLWLHGTPQRFAFDHTHTHTPDLGHGLDLDHAFSLALDLDHGLDLKRAFSLALDRTHTPAPDRHHALAQACNLVLDLIAGKSISALTLTLYGMVLAIQERFAGNSPAYESILLVKERREISPIEYYSVFISYSSKDQAFAERLYADLQNMNVRCWFAPEDLKIGDKFRVRINESLRLYDKLLLVLSEHSVKSPWVETEVETAFSKEHKTGKLTLFPVKLDNTVEETEEAWAATIHRTRHIGDFTRWKEHDEYQKGLSRLLRDLKQEALHDTIESDANQD